MTFSKMAKTLLLSALIVPTFVHSSGGGARAAFHDEKADAEARQQFDASNFRAKLPPTENYQIGVGAAWGGAVGALYGWLFGAMNNASYRYRTSSTDNSGILKATLIGTAIGAAAGGTVGFATALFEREKNRKRKEAIEATHGGDIRAAACQGNIPALQKWQQLQKEKGYSYPYTRTDRYGRSVLHYAAANGHTAAVDHIVSESPSHYDGERVVDSRDTGYSIPVGNKTVQYSNVITTRETYRVFPIDYQDTERRRTPLNWAMHGNHRLTALKLLHFGANPLLLDDQGKDAEAFAKSTPMFNDEAFTKAITSARETSQKKQMQPVRTTSTAVYHGVHDSY